ncbi:class I SAM-dependent methyltransferase [Virgibacillus flavescens]|uniref:class I SAM-dependent methyltransferase n=1 Tax=Virgibacillus flavescens TaxID=1611422 RepID=UPI003D339845
MEHRGSSVYDQKEFLTNYMKRRGRPDSPNNAIEGPIIDELVGNPSDKNILDLGCGDASFGKKLISQGAKFYTGLEGSEEMAALAKSNIPEEKGKVYHSTLESFHYPSDQFDLVASRFVLHYVSDIHKLFRTVYNSLQDKGKFIFSVQHPLTTSSFISKQSGDKRGNWVVDDYFHEGERKEPWIEEVVVKYHRTIENYFRALTQAGFSVKDLREGTPERVNFTSEEEFIRRQRIPVVLVFSCEK